LFKLAGLLLEPFAPLFDAALDPLALGCENLLKPFFDVVEDGTEVIAIELFLAALAHPVHELAQTGDVFTVWTLKPPIKKPL
jgi:hypothetical protein